MVDDVDAGVESYLTSWRNPDDPSPGEFVHKIQNRGLAQMVTDFERGKTYIPTWTMEWDVFLWWPTLSQLDTAGSLQRHTMNARRDKWNHVFTYSQDTCDEYANCAPNSICRSDRPIRCQCFRGYAPKFQKDWDLQDWSGGCARIKAMNCLGGDGFVEVREVKYPDVLIFWLNTTMSIGECETECSKNCSCAAYANPFITNGEIGCLMWLGDLIDSKELTAADSKKNIYIRVPASELGKSF